MDDKQLTKIAKFFLDHSHYVVDIETVKQYIQKHIDYGTGFVSYDEAGEIACVCRWNIINEGKTAEVLDLYIRKNCRGRKIIQELLRRGLQIFPGVNALQYVREIKRPGRGKVTIPVNRILKGEQYGKY